MGFLLASISSDEDATALQVQCVRSERCRCCPARGKGPLLLQQALRNLNKKGSWWNASSMRPFQLEPSSVQHKRNDSTFLDQTLIHEPSFWQVKPLFQCSVDAIASWSETEAVQCRYAATSAAGTATCCNARLSSKICLAHLLHFMQNAVHSYHDAQSKQFGPMPWVRLALCIAQLASIFVLNNTAAASS